MKKIKRQPTEQKYLGIMYMIFLNKYLGIMYMIFLNKYLEIMYMIRVFIKKSINILIVKSLKDK